MAVADARAGDVWRTRGYGTARRAARQGYRRTAGAGARAVARRSSGQAVRGAGLGRSGLARTGVRAHCWCGRPRQGALPRLGPAARGTGAQGQRAVSSTRAGSTAAAAGGGRPDPEVGSPIPSHPSREGVHGSGL